MRSIHDKSNKFELLFKQYYKPMMAAALRILGNTRDAEDAVQQAGESIFKNINKIKVIDSPETCSFVVLTAERKALDMVRARNKRREISIDETQEIGVEMTPSADDPLQEAIAQLPARYRQAIMLRFGMGYSVKETAKIMELSYENTKKIMQRAKEMLQQILTEKGEVLK
jgi:RNA polymerase sigma-70 factor (ECF subfamily)